MMWKTFAGYCVYKSSNGVQVYQNYLYRWLMLGENNALHTLINRRYPQKPELGYIYQLGFAVREKPANCCLLGLGGAGIVHALSPYLQQGRIDAVENNQEIIKIANDYFMTTQLHNLSIIEQDASVFVKDLNKKYQHLLVDLYDAQTFPQQCNSLEFFKNCKNLLLEDGILAVNIANLNEQWNIFKYIRAIFAERTVTLPVKGSSNVIVLACNSPSSALLLDMLKNSKCIKKLSWDMFWGCIAQI